MGFSIALELAYDTRLIEAKRLEPLRLSTINALEEKIPDIIWNGTAKRQLPGTINFSLPGLDGQTLVLYLDKEGIMTSTGSACTSADTEPSHVLLSLGRTDEQASASLRITMGRATTPAQLERFIKMLPPIVKRLQALALSR